MLDAFTWGHEPWCPRSRRPDSGPNKLNDSTAPTVGVQRARLPGRVGVDSAVVEASEQREVRKRVETEYLPAWCMANRPPVDPSRFRPDWSFLTPGLAHWFLEATVDGDIVQVQDGRPTLPKSRHTFLLYGHRGEPKLYREGFLEVAAAGILVRRYGWLADELRFQTPSRGRARRWAFDLLASVDREEVAIAAEAKWRQQDAEALRRALTACGERGEHSEDECGERKDDHRKYEGLAEFRPPALWIIGPIAFLESPDLVFKVEAGGQGVVLLTPTDPDNLKKQR